MRQKVLRPLVLIVAGALWGCTTSHSPDAALPPLTRPAEAASAPAASPPQTSTATPTPPVLRPCAIPQLRLAIVTAVNAQRAKGHRCGKLGWLAPAPALTWNEMLLGATQTHAASMAGASRFSHVGPDGLGLDRRVDATGYSWSALAENIGLGYESVDEVVRGWMASAGHCANLMKPDMRDMAAACMVGEDGVPYWVLDLAVPRFKR